MYFNHQLKLFWLTAAVSAVDAGIQKQIFESGTTTLIISNKEMEDIMKILRSLKEPGLLIKGASETTVNEVKEQKSGLLGMLLGTLGVITAGEGATTSQEELQRTRAKFLLLPHPLNYFKV